MKKFLSFVLAALMLSMLLTACGDTSSSVTPPAGAASGSSQPVVSAGGNTNDMAAELNFSYWDENQGSTMQSLIDKFNESYPNIKIELTSIPPDQYWTVLQAGLLADTAPDIFWLSGDWAKSLLPSGLVMPLNEYIDRDGVAMDKFPEAIKDLYTLDGEVYGIPKDYYSG